MTAVKTRRFHPLFADSARLTSATEQLKQRLADVQNKARLQENEFQLVNGDYERLLQQHEQDKERAADRDARWKSRLERGSVVAAVAAC